MALNRLILATCLTLISTTSIADGSSYSCQLYFQGDNDVPLNSKSILSRAPNSALEICVPRGHSTSDSKNAAYALVLPPVRGELGACQITRRSIFEEGSTWTYTPPKDRPYLGNRSVFMMIADGECPRQDDPRYIMANDISEGAFIAANRFWAQISSDKNLDQVSAAVRSSTEFRSFEKAIRSNNQGSSALRLVSIDSFSPDPDRAVAHYFLTINGPKNAWGLVVDFDDGKLKLLRIDSVIY